MITSKKTAKRERLKRHIRLTISGTSQRPRLCVYRSLKHIYVQLIDDSTGRTLLALSDISKECREEFRELNGQVALGKRLGMVTAKKALEKNVKSVIFDRGGYLYHGAVKAVAEGAREGGLRF